MQDTLENWNPIVILAFCFRFPTNMVDTCLKDKPSVITQWTEPELIGMYFDNYGVWFNNFLLQLDEHKPCFS